MAHAQRTAAVETVEFEVHGRTVRVMARPASPDKPLKLARPARARDVVRIASVPVEPCSFTLPGTPDGLVIAMDDRGDGHVSSTGEERVSLGSDGMWWILTRLVEALEDPQTISQWPRFLTLGEKLGGPAVQASLRYDDNSVCIVWRRLSSGVVEELLSWTELSCERAQSWLDRLRPIVDDIEERGAHHRRLLPARTAEKWAMVLER